MDERALRINTAAELLDDHGATADVVREVARRFRLSERQARRYVDRARKDGPVEVPEASVVFTVRLPGGLVARLRAHGSDTGRTLSSLVAEAIEELLGRIGSGRRGG